MQGTDLPRVIKEADIGIKLCHEFNYELLKLEMMKMKEEFEGLKIKSEAILKNTCAMDLKE